MKRVLEFTKHQMDTWIAVLSGYPSVTVNRAIIAIGLSTDPFPDLGKVVMKCQQIEWQKTSQYAPGRDESKVSDMMIANAAKALELRIR